MNRMSFFDKKTGLIGLVWTILLFGPGYFSYIERQKQMPIKAKIAFTKAIVEEKNLFIHLFLCDYDARRSKNTIPGNEKIEWANQSYLTMEDSCRHRLDSLFRLQLKKEDVPVEWSAVSCTNKGKTHAVRKDLLQEDFLVYEVLYRLNPEKENDIILRAYIKLADENLLWNHWYTYLLLSLWLAGGIFLCLYKKRKNNSVGNTEETPKDASLWESEPIQWKQLKDDLLFDEQCGVLKRGEQVLQLKNLDLLYFRAFLNKEHYTLTYEDFLVTVYKRPEVTKASRTEKNRISKEIIGLREHLKCMDIEIDSVTKVGYSLKIKDRPAE